MNDDAEHHATPLLHTQARNNQSPPKIGWMIQRRLFRAAFYNALTDGLGYGEVDDEGSGYGDGECYGDGTAYGYGHGDGPAYGISYGDGTGEGMGWGYGEGHERGSGRGYGLRYRRRWQRFWRRFWNKCRFLAQKRRFVTWLHFLRGRKMEIGKMVLITTDKDRRGVFMGELIMQAGDLVILKDAQMAVYWPAENHGVLGLAKDGPKQGARISPVVPQLELDGVTMIAEVTPEALAAWRAEPWSE